MKKIMIALVAVAFPMMIHAQSEGLFSRKPLQGAKADLSAYAAKGAIPEVDGKVVFKDVISAPGKTKEDIFAKVAQWASFRFEPNSTMGLYTDPNFFKNLEYSIVKTADKASGSFRCQGAEEMVFSSKPLAKNFTQAFYILDLKVSDGKIEFNLHDISYNIDMGENNFTRVLAENWITDKECLNKKGKMMRIPRNYRVKTIDLVAELKKEITETINK